MSINHVRRVSRAFVTLFGLAALVLSSLGRAMAQPPVPGVRFPALQPRPGHIIGRAAFADGRPLPFFLVSADSVAGTAGQVRGVNGYYDLPITDSRIAIVQHVRATIHITYAGEKYVLMLHPSDGRSDESTQGAFVGDVRRGVVRDFVFQLVGRPKNGYGTNPPPAATSTDSLSASFDLPAQLRRLLGFAESRSRSPRPHGSSMGCGLHVPGSISGDADADRAARRRHARQNHRPHVSACLQHVPVRHPARRLHCHSHGYRCAGVTKAIHLRMQIYGTPVSSGPTPASSVQVRFPADPIRASMDMPTLTMTP